MDDRLRRSAAHVLVNDLDSCDLDDIADHHLRRVLRLRDGESVTLTDGRGRWRAACWTTSGVEPVGETVTVERGPEIAVALAIPKQDKPEWTVSKLVECGVDRIILLHCERSVVRWDAGRSERNVERLERVARSALEQSRRVHRCVIEGPVSASAVLPEAVAAEPGGRHLEAGDRLVAIGPEGGWSPSEVDLAHDRVELADTVLRVETAALVAAVKMTGMR